MACNPRKDTRECNKLEAVDVGAVNTAHNCGISSVACAFKFRLPRFMIIENLIVKRRFIVIYSLH